MIGMTTNLYTSVKRLMNESHSHIDRRAGTRRPTTVRREYSCDGLGHASRFVEGLMRLQERTYHSVRLVVEGSSVTLETWTRGINEATDLDEEYAEEADAVFARTR